MPNDLIWYSISSLTTWGQCQRTFIISACLYLELYKPKFQAKLDAEKELGMWKFTCTLDKFGQREVNLWFICK